VVNLITYSTPRKIWIYKEGRFSKELKFDRNAFVVLERIIDNMEKKTFIPTTVNGDWNIRIKPDNGRTVINVNLNNITDTYGREYYSTVTHSVVEPIVVNGKTTGMFEKTIYDIVK
jgi:hypothetical protein